MYLTPTDDLWLRLRGHFQKDDDSSAATALVSSTGNTSCTGKVYSGIDRAGNRVDYIPGTAYFCDGIDIGDPDALDSIVPMAFGSSGPDAVVEVISHPESSAEATLVGSSIVGDAQARPHRHAP